MYIVKIVSKARRCSINPLHRDNMARLAKKIQKDYLPIQRFSC